MIRTGRERHAPVLVWGLPAVIATLAFVLYWLTLAPGLTFGDCGDLVVAAYQLGVPHPTGYPLYTLLGHVWIALLPRGDIAWRMNLLSAVFAAAAVGTLYRCCFELSGSRSGAFLAAGLFAVSPALWSQAVVTEVYTLHVFLTSLVLLALVRLCAKPAARTGRAVALIYGLALTHHMVSLWLLPGLGVAIALLAKRRAGDVCPARWLWMGFLPLLLYFYLPWAALRDPPWNWGDPRTPARFLAHVTGSLYREKMGPAARGVLRDRVAAYVGLRAEADYALTAQYPVLVLWLAPVGAVALLRKRSAEGLALLLSYVATMAWALNYGIRDIDPYFLIPHMVVAVWLAEGCTVSGAWLSHMYRRPRAVQLTARCVAAGLPILLALTHAASMDRSHDLSAPQQTRALLSRTAPRSLLVLSGDAWGFPVAYHYHVLHERRDLRLLFYRDFLAPEYRRLVERERTRGLWIPPRPSDPDLRGGMAWLRAILQANLPYRRCYLIGNAFSQMEAQGSLRTTLGPVHRLAAGQPVYELVDTRAQPTDPTGTQRPYRPHQEAPHGRSPGTAAWPSAP